jgi:hypothetical protein
LTQPLSKVQRFAPKLKFSSGEKYFPCDLFFGGKDIKQNKRKYLLLDEHERSRKICCYFHVVQGAMFDAYEYWYYYAFNEYLLIPRTPIADNHDHDLEYAIVFVNKKNDRPEHLLLNQHFWQNHVPLNGTIPAVFVEKGGHGMFVERKASYKWQPDGDELTPEPKKDTETLRAQVVSAEPRDIIDGKEKLIGEDYDQLKIGKLWGPSTPWSRPPVYYLPIAEILEKVRPDLGEPGLFELRMVQPKPISLPYTEPTLEENVRLALEQKLGKAEDYEPMLNRRAIR